MTFPWPHAQSSVPTPCGNCPRCGGQLYAYLTHQCQTALPFRDLSPLYKVLANAG